VLLVKDNPPLLEVIMTQLLACVKVGALQLLCVAGGGCLAAARHSVLLAEDNPPVLEEQMQVIMTQLLAYVKVGALLRVHVWVLT
jgi:uncharacterized protein YneF (UPF0154 family)